MLKHSYMKEKFSHIIITEAILAKYFAGEATPEEAMAVDEWRYLTESNEQEFITLFEAWNATNKQPFTNANSLEVWDEIQSVVHKPKPRLFTLAKMSVAAAALVFIACSVVYFFKPRSINPKSTTLVSLTCDTTKQIVLPDNSTIGLVANSSLKYDSIFTTCRNIYLDGDAYFDVTSMADKPFIVNVDNIQVEVLGTAFNISKNDSTLLTTVYQGKVAMYNPQKRIIISAGQTGIYNKHTNSFSLLPSADKNEISYITNCFYFENNDLQTVANYLSKAYNKKILINDPELSSLRLSAVFEKQPLNYILDVITTTLDIRYEQVHNEIHFTKK